MTAFLNNLQNFMGNFFNFQVVKLFPRHSVRFAKNYFENKPLIVAEIGTFSMLKELNIKKLYIIDPYEYHEKYKDRENDKNEKVLSDAFKIAKKRLKNYSSKIVFIKRYSNEAIKDIPLCDFVYIDGNHTYEFVKEDIQNYFLKLNSDGILAGHDITNKKFNQDIVRAVIEFSYKNKLVPFVSRTDWWILKRNKIALS